MPPRRPNSGDDPNQEPSDEDLARWEEEYGTHDGRSWQEPNALPLTPSEALFGGPGDPTGSRNPEGGTRDSWYPAQPGARRDPFGPDSFPITGPNADPEWRDFIIEPGVDAEGRNLNNYDPGAFTPHVEGTKTNPADLEGIGLHRLKGLSQQPDPGGYDVLHYTGQATREHELDKIPGLEAQYRQGRGRDLYRGQWTDMGDFPPVGQPKNAEGGVPMSPDDFQKLPRIERTAQLPGTLSTRIKSRQGGYRPGPGWRDLGDFQDQPGPLMRGLDTRNADADTSVDPVIRDEAPPTAGGLGGFDAAPSPILPGGFTPAPRPPWTGGFDQAPGSSGVHSAAEPETYAEFLRRLLNSDRWPGTRN